MFELLGEMIKRQQNEDMERLVKSGLRHADPSSLGKAKSIQGLEHSCVHLEEWETAIRQ